MRAHTPVLPRAPPRPGCHKALGRVPCAVQEVEGPGEVMTALFSLAFLSLTLSRRLQSPVQS